MHIYMYVYNFVYKYRYMQASQIHTPSPIHMNERICKCHIITLSPV